MYFLENPRQCIYGRCNGRQKEVELIMREFELIKRDIEDIEDKCTESIIKDVLMSMDLIRAYHLSYLPEELTRQLLS